MIDHNKIQNIEYWEDNDEENKEIQCSFFVLDFETMVRCPCNSIGSYLEKDDNLRTLKFFCMEHNPLEDINHVT